MAHQEGATHWAFVTVHRAALLCVNLNQHDTSGGCDALGSGRGALSQNTNFCHCFQKLQIDSVLLAPCKFMRSSTAHKIMLGVYYMIDYGNLNTQNPNPIILLRISPLGFWSWCFKNNFVPNTSFLTLVILPSHCYLIITVHPLFPYIPKATHIHLIPIIPIPFAKFPQIPSLSQKIKWLSLVPKFIISEAFKRKISLD